MTTTQKTLFAILVAVAIGWYASGHTTVPSLGAGDSTQNQIYSAPNNGSTTLRGGTTTLILATSTSRNALILSNTGTSTVWITIGQRTGTSTGILLSTSSPFVLHPNTMFTAAIYGFASATTSVSYVESVKP